MKKVLVFMHAIFLFNIIAAKTMIVTVPVANMRTGPGDSPYGVVGPALSQDSRTPDTNFEQDSQLLMNELVLVEGDTTSDPGFAQGLAGQVWYQIQALVQPGLVNGTWQGCPGFIQKTQVKPAPYFPCINAVVKERWGVVTPVDQSNDCIVEKLSLGTYLSAIPFDETYSLVELASGTKGLIKNSALYWLNTNVEQDIETLRTSLVEILLSFEGSPYIWGGCSAYDKTNTMHLTGVDCSGLVYLAMRAHGLLIPRNSHAQYLRAQSVASGADLKPGDLIYTRSIDRERISHVLVFLGDEKFIETTGLGFSSATQTQNPEMLTTRIISSQDRFGCAVANLCNNLEFSENAANKMVQKVMYLRTFFGSDEQVQELRNNFYSVVNQTQIERIL